MLMKKTGIKFFILLICFHTVGYAQENRTCQQSNCTRYYDLLVEQSADYIKKYGLFVALIPLLTYYHKDIALTAHNRPYLAACLLYCGMNYLSDTYRAYLDQQAILGLIGSLKKTTLHLIIAYGIINYIKNQPTLKFNKEYEIDDLVQDLPYSFHEITLITIKAYQELKASLQLSNIHLPLECEEFVFLCHPSSIDLHCLLYLVQKNPTLYKSIYQIQNQDIDEIENIIAFLKEEIAATFLALEKSLLTTTIYI